MDDLIALVTWLFTKAPWRLLSWLAVLMVVGAIVGKSTPRTAVSFAIVPRSGKGLVGLLTAPFVHANFAHLFANLPPFLVLGALVLRRGETPYLITTAMIALSQGLLLWLLGRKSAHVGMSGVIPNTQLTGTKRASEGA